MAKAKINFEDEQVRSNYRHTTSHILAQAVKKIWPDAKLAIGPAIDNGFYYDFDMEHKLTDQDLLKIQKEMKKVVQANYPLERFELPREEAIKFMEEREEPYKVELIEDLPDDATISFYRQGDFVDLCAGPHMESTGQIKAIKLQSVAGAYWRGDSNRKMLQRIYGTCFPTQDEDYAIKPMNCPGSILAYKRKLWSYRELPVRMAELGQVHRHELSGALHGLMRVRTFVQDDAHIFMLPEQTRDEVINVIQLYDDLYKLFNLPYHIELSTMPEDHMGSEEEWAAAESALKEAIETVNVPYVINEGDGAFYGPKLDFHLEDSIGRTWQCGTIQLDMQMPQRFDINYIGPDGEKHRPLMIHRAAFGSVERFIGILIEHFAGKFPLWLAPVQVRLMTVTEKYSDYAVEVSKAFEEAGIRSECDIRNEKIGYKIREARNERVPYMCIIGEKEVEAGILTVRNGKTGEQFETTPDELQKKLIEEIKSKSL